MVPLTAQAIRKIGHRYEEGGLERALYEVSLVTTEITVRSIRTSSTNDVS